MHNVKEEAQQREFSFSDQEFTFLARLANDQTGIVLAEHKKDMVYSRLVRRLRALSLESFSDYCSLLQTVEGQTEVLNLVNALTTNLTSFFREKHHFEHLKTAVLAPLASHPPAEKKLRIWSAGCSTGMEAYSIAMTVKSSLPSLRTWDARILATDIDTNVLAIGEAGEYSSEQLKNIPPQFHGEVASGQKEDSINMSDTLKDLIAFKHLNLLESWPMTGLFDAVFCRNVVIYFDKPTQAKLFSRIAALLKPRGWLYIGHSENLFKVSNDFELVGRTIYRKVS